MTSIRKLSTRGTPTTSGQLWIWLWNEVGDTRWGLRSPSTNPARPDRAGPIRPPRQRNIGAPTVDRSDQMLSGACTVLTSKTISSVTRYPVGTPEGATCPPISTIRNDRIRSTVRAARPRTVETASSMVSAWPDSRTVFVIDPAMTPKANALGTCGGNAGLDAGRRSRL